MVYSKRVDSRKFDQPREIEARVGIIKRADGSAYFKIGKTIAIAAVYGPRELYPAFKQNPETGILRCNYDMMSFSVTERKKPGPTRRSVEISLVTENALLPALDLSLFPNTVIDVFIQIIQADAGTRCAGISAAAMALADAGIPMKDLVSSISVGKVGDKIVLDLNKEEEDYEEGSTDIPVAIMPRNGEISLLQLDGDVEKEELLQALKLAKKGCDEIYKIQRQALKERYGGSAQDEL
ncbi:exosome complex exonuclease Rrp41 [Candidatus Woesearchaeota archaeon]|nr:exosome complex exonuclease Rrp41 [Candidatus Woesearchaeota archaeon]